MSQYRKKPVVIEAVRMSIYMSMPEWLDKAFDSGVVRFVPGECAVKIETLEGTMTAQQGDWIIQGVQGEIYPCKHDIFEAGYEPV